MDEFVVDVKMRTGKTITIKVDAGDIREAQEKAEEILEERFGSDAYKFLEISSNGNIMCMKGE